MNGPLRHASATLAGYTTCSTERGGEKDRHSRNFSSIWPEAKLEKHRRTLELWCRILPESRHAAPGEAPPGEGGEDPAGRGGGAQDEGEGERGIQGEYTQYDLYWTSYTSDHIKILVHCSVSVCPHVYLSIWDNFQISTCTF